MSVRHLVNAFRSGWVGVLAGADVDAVTAPVEVADDAVEDVCSEVPFDEHAVAPPMSAMAAPANTAARRHLGFNVPPRTGVLAATTVGEQRGRRMATACARPMG